MKLLWESLHHAGELLRLGIFKWKNNQRVNDLEKSEIVNEFIRHTKPCHCSLVLHISKDQERWEWLGCMSGVQEKSVPRQNYCRAINKGCLKTFSQTLAWEGKIVEINECLKRVCVGNSQRALRWGWVYSAAEPSSHWEQKQFSSAGTSCLCGSLTPHLGPADRGNVALLPVSNAD